VNRGNWYWDSKNRIAPSVQAVSCDRKNGVESCEDLVQLVKNVGESSVLLSFIFFVFKSGCITSSTQKRTNRHLQSKTISGAKIPNPAWEGVTPSRTLPPQAFGHDLGALPLRPLQGLSATSSSSYIYSQTPGAHKYKMFIRCLSSVNSAI